MATKHCNAASGRNEQEEELIAVYRQLPKKAQKFFLRQFKANSDIRTSTKLTDEEKKEALAQRKIDWMAEFKRSFPKAHEIYIAEALA